MVCGVNVSSPDGVGVLWVGIVVDVSSPRVWWGVSGVVVNVLWWFSGGMIVTVMVVAWWGCEPWSPWVVGHQPWSPWVVLTVF